MITVRVPLQRLVVTQLGDTRRWQLDEPYRATLMVDGAEHTITIPAGFTYDRASVPDLAGILIPRDSLGLHGPLLHDALYRYSGVLWHAGEQREPSCDPWRAFSRSEADQSLEVVCRADGVDRWRATVARWAVRLFARRW